VSQKSTIRSMVPNVCSHPKDIRLELQNKTA